jgi:hypothetical protein
MNAFALPPVNAGRFGTCGLGILEGPGEINVNVGLAKQFPLTEHSHLRFEATFYKRTKSYELRTTIGKRQQPKHLRSVGGHTATRTWWKPHGAISLTYRVLSRRSPISGRFGLLATQPISIGGSYSP